MTAALAALAASQVEGQTIGLWVAVIAMFGTLAAAIVTGGFGLAGKKDETRQSSDAGLRDDQREFIQTLKDDNKDLRNRVAELEHERVTDHARIAELEQSDRRKDRQIEALTRALQAAGIPIPDLG